MKNLLLSFLLNLNLIIMAQVDPQSEKIKSFIIEAKNIFAPDKRTALLEINFEKVGNKYILKGETNIPQSKNFLIKKLSDEGFLFEDNIELLPSKNLGKKRFGVVNLSVSNCRSKPEHPAELSTQALLGTPIKILKKNNNGFYLIQTPDKYLSWMDDDGFELMTEQEWSDWKKSEKIIYLKEFGWAFESPDFNSSHISDLVAGNILKLINEDGDYYQVEFPDKRIAYVLKNESEKFNYWYNNLNPIGENILKTAYRFMGVPYLWGGTSAKGMDCSGFTKTVFFLNGLIIPRDASQQVETGNLIDTKDGWENLQAGDLLFFGTKSSGNRKERITHVAIYIGDGDYIHAAGRVRINSFNKSKSYYSSYRKSGFIRAKRILNSINENGIEKILDNEFYK